MSGAFIVGSQVFGSRALLIVVLVLYLLMRLVDWRLGKPNGAPALPLVSPVWSLILLGFGCWSLYDGASRPDVAAVVLGALLIVACADSLVRWRRERDGGRSASI